MGSHASHVVKSLAIHRPRISGDCAALCMECARHSLRGADQHDPTDLGKGTQVDDKINYWKEIYPDRQITPVSALKGTNVDILFNQIVDLMPQHPPYYPKDEYTDKPERFFAAEIVREKIFNNYSQEIPYSCEVAIEEFKEDEKIIRMRALIFVERNSQKGILIGKGGSALKKVGIQARKDLENIFGKQVHLETFVKVDPDWRKSKAKLRKYGYN